MFEEKVELPVYRDALSRPLRGDLGRKCTLRVNAFRLEMSPGSYIHTHEYTIKPAPKNLSEERRVLTSIWEDLIKMFTVFVVKLPGQIYSPSTNLRGNPEMKFISSDGHTIKLNLRQAFPSELVNVGMGGCLEIVAQHIVKRLMQKARFQKLGRRYYSNRIDQHGPNSNVLTSLEAGMLWSSAHGPLFQLNTIGRLVAQQSVLETMRINLEGDEALKFADSYDGAADVRAEWLRACVGATVLTSHNYRKYLLKTVRFDMTPLSCFWHFDRDSKTSGPMTFEQYYQFYYSMDTKNHSQPMLEAYPEQESESIFLCPDMCRFIGNWNDVRKDKSLTDVLRMIKAQPNERFNAICKMASRTAAGVAPPTRLLEPRSPSLLESWNFHIAKAPLEVEARVLDSFEVELLGLKKLPMTDGNFHRSIRLGLHWPGKLDNWLFVYSESDESVIDIVVASLNDTAQEMFGLHMNLPTKIQSTLQREDLVQKLAKHMTPSTQIVLLLTPQRDARRVYRIFKQTTCLQYPCVSQVLRSETVRKRQSIASILTGIVLQIKAKLCGAPWQVDLRTPPLGPLFKARIMAVGIDVFRTPNGERYVGFAASMDRFCGEYFSFVSMLHEKRLQSTSISMKIQEAYRDALVQFAKFNDGYLPNHVVVYRASVDQRMWTQIRETEIEGVLTVNNHLKTPMGTYDPKLTWLLIEKHTLTRFFAGTNGEIQNAEAGTVVDSPALVGDRSFYLVNQSVSKGTSNPSHYTVIFDSGDVTANALQTLTYRLSFLYFNFSGAVRMPAPAQYARKIARFAGMALRAEPHKRLLRTFFYL